MTGPSASSGCAPTAELLPELALGILSGTERADVLAHLDRCAVCRDASAAWAATVDVLPTLIADEEPPSGFEARTLERLRADRARRPRRRIMKRWLGVAAIVAFVMIATLAAVRIIDADNTTPSARGPKVTATEMIGYSGHRAGHVYLTQGNERYVFLDVDYGVKTGRYRIESVDAGKRSTQLGMVTITDGQGTWAGELPEGAAGRNPATVRLVDSDGGVLCWANFDRTA